MDDQTDLLALAAHGGAHLPSVEVDSYNVDIRDDENSLAIALPERPFVTLSMTCASCCASMVKIR
jgi:hypothetical protein